MKTTVIAFLAIGALLTPFGFGQLPPNPLSGNLVVVDSTGRRVGPVIGSMQFGTISSSIGTTAVTVLSFQGKLLQVYILRSQFEAPALLYTSYDCTGQPFGDPSWGPFLATGISADNTLYFESGPTQPITVNSGFFTGHGASGCTMFSEMIDAVPMSPAIDLNGFKAPFAVISLPRP
jgi:hypothetical protein